MANLNQIEVEDTLYNIEDGATRTSGRVLVTGSDGKVTVSSITSILLGYLSGLSGNVQELLNDKAASTHTHSDYVEKDTGNINLNTSATSGDDKALYDAIVALNWQSEVITT